MTRSVMEPTPLRHASLALDTYVQVGARGSQHQVCSRQANRAPGQTRAARAVGTPRRTPPPHRAPAPNAPPAARAPHQVTSPIRRYTDMMAHYNVKAALRGQPPPFPAPALASVLAAAGEGARGLGRAENEVARYWAAEFMRQRAGETFEATVLGPFRAESGLYALLLEGTGLETIAKVGRGAGARARGRGGGLLAPGCTCPRAPLAQLPHGGGARRRRGLSAAARHTGRQVPWDAAPGERLAATPIDADPPAGFYRLSILGELDSPVRAAREAAAAAAEAGALAEIAAATSAAREGAGDAGDVDMEAVWALVDSSQREEGEDADGGGGGGGVAAPAV